MRERTRLEKAKDYGVSATDDGYWHRHPTQLFRKSVRGKNRTQGVRVKSDLRDHCATVQPRLNTDPAAVQLRNGYANHSLMHLQ